ncbi:hypothetical protein KZC51_16830 [Microbacterium sp. SSW1-49]|uniref:Alpha-amylase n=1 Tax=Microbacterium croceum TaxID=2851645 RepID=A0ABT0FIA3_9MICO|nr:hypothetical protein [Microbacterium croceum]MCK2037794.1 hypothetical protein [Microbacterium croceum]
MVFPALSRSARSTAAAIAAALLASMLVVAAAPASASVVPTTTVVDPAHAGFADRLPVALSEAAALAAESPIDATEGSADVTGTVAFPAATDLTMGRTFVVAYAPNSDTSSPLAAAAVAADGSYVLRAPVGQLVLAVLSEGRAVFDIGGPSGGGFGPDDVRTLDVEGLEYSPTLEQSALITGKVTVPASVSTAGQKVAAVVYPSAGTAEFATAANYVTDTGAYAVGGLPAGDYRLAFVSAAAGAASEWWNDAPSFAKARSIALGAVQVATADITLATLGILDTAIPKISGTTTVGQTLTAAPGAWTSGATLTYQWYANGAAIAKATAASLKLPAAVAGKRITVKVTGKKTAFATKTETSVATAAVLRPLAAPVPAITGTTTVGQTLKVKPGAWTAGTKLTYQWYLNGVAVAKATAASFRLPSSATLKTVTVVVKGTKAGYATASKRSKATAAVKGILKTSTPQIKGSTIVGSKLSVSAGTWTSGTKLTYQWYANGKAISRATGSSLAVTAALVKKRITVKVTGTKSGYVTAAKTSAKSGVVSYPARTKPVSAWNCPAWAPIKGNANSGIYHVPSGQYYSRTKPEVCFSSEAAAVKAGYRKSKR